MSNVVIKFLTKDNFCTSRKIKETRYLHVLFSFDLFSIRQNVFYFLKMSQHLSINPLCFQFWLKMCTIVVTIRAVLWYVMSLAGTLMILVALFTNKWLEGELRTTNLQSACKIFLSLLSHFCFNDVITQQAKCYQGF